MNKTLKEREQEIDKFNFSFVYEKMEYENLLNQNETLKIELEFKKFLKLILREDGPLAMVDKRVDELWHWFILFTPQYHHFCNEIMGFFVHHQPRTSLTPVPSISVTNFFETYKKHFGAIDKFWFESLTSDEIKCIENNYFPEDSSLRWSGWIGKEMKKAVK